jgi:hypothetical protein
MAPELNVGLKIPTLTWASSISTYQTACSGGGSFYVFILAVARAGLFVASGRRIDSAHFGVCAVNTLTGTSSRPTRDASHARGACACQGMAICSLSFFHSILGQQKHKGRSPRRSEGLLAMTTRQQYHVYFIYYSQIGKFHI